MQHMECLEDVLDAKVVVLETVMIPVWVVVN